MQNERCCAEEKARQVSRGTSIPVFVPLAIFSITGVATSRSATTSGIVSIISTPASCNTITSGIISIASAPASSNATTFGISYHYTRNAYGRKCWPHRSGYGWGNTYKR